MSDSSEQLQKVRAFFDRQLEEAREDTDKTIILSTPLTVPDRPSYFDSEVDPTSTD